MFLCCDKESALILSAPAAVEFSKSMALLLDVLCYLTLVPDVRSAELRSIVPEGIV